MEFRLSKVRNYYGTKARTTDYRGTVTSLDDSDLNAIRDNVKESNAAARKLRRANPERNDWMAKSYPILRVRIMPRGPRRENARKDYPGRYGLSYDSYLPQRYATHYDVYVGVDTHAEYKFNKEIETGLRPGELRKIEELQHQIWRLEATGRARKWAS